MLLNSLDRSFVVQKAKTGCYVQGAKEDRQRQGMPTAGASRAVRTSSNHEGEREMERMVDLFNLG